MTPIRKRKSLNNVVRAACGTAFAAGAMCSSAQETAEPRGVFRIDVTGSNIPRTDVEAMLPVQIITREEIEHSGSTTVAEVMSRVSANILGFNDQLSIGDALAAPGISSINLRGIGDGSTLVLVNGRRVANYAFDGGTVDVNSIPLAAIDRIEILKDGASAIYGTDAIAGVVNFILRKDYRGFEATAHGAWTEHGGGDQSQATVSAGYGDVPRGFNVFATASYQKDQALSAAARPFSRTGFIPGEGIELLTLPSFPANIFSSGLFFSPALASGCTPPASLPTINPFSRAREPVCGFDAVRFRDLVPSVERTAVFGRGTLQTAADHQVFVEANYSRNRFVLRTEPTPVSMFQSNDRVPLLYPAGGPFYPTAFANANDISGDLNIFYRTLPLGLRIHSVETSAWRGVIGMEGVARGWDYSAALTYSRTEETERFDSGEISIARLQEAMATGLINPFGPSGPEGDALLAGTQVTGDMHEAKGSTLELEAKASKAVYRLPAGPLAIALGAEGRREELENRFAPFVTSGDVSQSTDLQSAAGSRSVQALFAEANVPLFKGFELQLAARYDHYSDFGGTVNPKIALRWQPVKSLLLRTSWGTGFRAPTLYDLHTPLSHVFLPEFSDPVRCPVTQAPGDCNTPFSAAVGGNPNLQPETSKQFNAGVVWEPLPALSLGADYWRIAKEDTIGGLNEVTVFQNFEVFAPTNIIRGPVDAAFPGLPGPIETVLLWRQNVGRLRTSGIDVDARWRGSATRIGRFGIAFDGTYYIDWKAQPDGLNFESGLGRADSIAGGAFPRWKHRATLDWSLGPWGVTLSQTYQSGYLDSNADRAGNPLPTMRRVAPYDVWDVDARYTGFRNWTLTLGVKNVMDRAPPFTNLQGPPVGYDPTYADPRGRVFYGAVRYAFE
jgi:iron complex outermembrane recepter protein